MASLNRKSCRGHTYWQIVESRRINGKPRPIVLIHLGTADTLLQRLQKDPLKPKTAKILEFGALAALWNIAEELCLVKTIDKYAPKREQGLSCGQYMLLAALNRCVHVSSKSSLYDWYRRTVLQRLLPATKSALTSQRFWDHMNSLNEDIISQIEEELARLLVNHFKIDLNTLLFDATNFDTYIDTQTVCSLAQRGHAKSKRKDLRLLGLALLVSTDFQVPLFSHLYPGNQHDSKTFNSVIESLVARYRIFAQQCKEITLVYDGGNNSNENASQVDKSKYHFVTSLTITHHKDLLSIPLRRFNPLKGARLKDVLAYRTSKVIWGKERTVVIVRSPQLLAGQIAGIISTLKKKRDKLYELRSKLLHSQKPETRGKGYTRQSLQKQLNDIVSGQYISEILTVKITGTKNLDFTFYTDPDAFNKLKQYRLGKRILCTDNQNWTTEEIVLASRAQFHVENAFKQMKNPHWVSFSPVFHWTDQKLRVHAFYCILALTMCALLQRKASQSGIDISIPELLKNLSEVQEVVNLYAPASGKGRFRAEFLLSERSGLQERLCRIFEVYKHCRP